MAKIRAQNAEREKRHLEVEADKKKAEADKSAVKVSGSTSKDDEGKWIQTTTHELSLFYSTALFIKEVLKRDKVNSTACASKKNITVHRRAFCATHRLLICP